MTASASRCAHHGALAATATGAGGRRGSGRGACVGLGRGRLMREKFHTGKRRTGKEDRSDLSVCETLSVPPLLRVKVLLSSPRGFTEPPAAPPAPAPTAP